MLGTCKYQTSIAIENAHYYFRPECYLLLFKSTIPPEMLIRKDILLRAIARYINDIALSLLGYWYGEATTKQINRGGFF